MSNPFVYADEEYQRDIDPIEHYIQQASFYLSKVKGIDISVAETKLRELINNPTLENNIFNSIINPSIKHTYREENGDRIIVTDSLTSYIDKFKKNDYIVAPTLTTYVKHTVNNALTNNFIRDNKKKRNIFKKEKLKFKALNNDIKASYYDKMQANMKLFNNAMSGGLTSPYNPLFNKTGHSTLTSVTRITTSNSNSNNEKLLTGNRHYSNTDIIIENITFIVSNINKEVLLSIMTKYNLYYPTVEDCKKVILRSSKLYRITDIKECDNLLNKLDELERAWFVYCNDFYHLCIYNEHTLKELLTKAVLLVHDDNEYTEKDVYSYPEEYIIAGHNICYSLIKGKGKDYTKMKELGILKTLVPTIRNCYNTVMEYGDLFSAFFKTDIVPHNIAKFPESLRRCVLTSDTDSTIFTSQELIFWYLGKEEFNQQGRSIQAFLILLSTFTTTHILSHMSAQIGTIPNLLHELYMKNEFTFDVYVTTQVAKHYYASISVQEGNVFDRYEREFKGVQLVSSNLPLEIKIKSKNMMNEIMDKCINNEKISIIEYLNQVKDIEQQIINAIKLGDLTYFKVYKIKDKDSYTDGLFSNYFYYELWNDVFGHRYAKIDMFPFQAIKVSTILDTKRRLTDWLENLDLEFKENMTNWISRSKRKDLPMIMLPAEIVRSYGLPKEIQSIVLYKKMVAEICHVFYMILETLGFYLKDDHIVSDYF